MEKPILKLYKYENNTFSLQAIIDDFRECSFERNLYQAGNFTISINYNIPNAQLFRRGLFVQFGSDPYDFGEIISISDAIGSDGKGSQLRTITGYDSRYIFKRRVIKNMNSNGLWVMTDKGEAVIRALIDDQCGSNAEEKRRLPIINTAPDNPIGKEYSASEQFSNLYEVCKTIATQSEIGWRLKFSNSTLTLECYEGTNRSQTVQFSTNFDSLADGNFTDSSDSFTNAIYVGGKGQNDDRDIYEGEDGTPSGLNRFESWDNQSSMTTESEYEAEALSMLIQYGQTITVSGNGLAKCPYIFREEYDVGDVITLAFSGKSAIIQILSVTERWMFGQYDIQFSFGKPVNNIQDQLQLMLRKIQSASEKSESTDSVRWYTIPDDSQMPKADVTYRTIGFIGNVGSGATFQLYLDNEKTGAKTYHIYFKQLAGAGKLTLTTGKEGASNLVLNAGTYVAIVYVDENGNVTSQGMTATSAVEAGNNQPVTSDGVNSAIQSVTGGLVTGVKGNSESTYRTGNVNITKENIGLGNVDNTSDLNKPISTATQTALDGKVPTSRTVNGKALSSDITIDASDVGALPDSTVIPPAQVNSDWNSTSGVSEILNKPTIPSKTSELTNDSNFATTSDVSTAEANAKNLANATGTLEIGHGGTNATSASGAEYNIIGAVETVNTTFDDNRYVAVRNQTVSASNGTFRWFKVSNLWEYIKGKISSVLGLTSTDYGGKASTAGTADNANKVNISTSNSNGDFPLLFSGSVTAGNKTVYTDTVNDASYNPSTNEMKVAGNVLGSNLPYFGSVYSAGTYNSGYYLLAQLEGTGSGNHDISFAGVVYDNSAGATKKTEFYIYARGNAQTISISNFFTNGASSLFATYEAVATNKFILRLYGQILGNWHRYNTIVEYASTGDVSSKASNRTVTFPGTRVASLTGTQITKQNMVTGSNTANVAKALCNTVDINEAGSTVAKTASLSGFVLKKGSKLLVNLVNANTVASATLNVNETGAKTVYLNGGNAVTASNWTAGIWYAVYNGTSWYLDESKDAHYARYAVIAEEAEKAKKWSTARNFTISDNDSTNSGPATSVDGSSAVTLKLPSTIKASLDGNSVTATTAYKIRTSAPSSPEVGDIWIS